VGVFGEGIGENLIASGLVRVTRKQVWRLRIVGCYLFRRKADLRVAFSAIIKVSHGDRYLLIRNLHRPECFAPFGGVYKYFEEADSQLEKLEFRPQDDGPGEDMVGDLRGFIPRRRLPAFLAWFRTNENREHFSECLRRELSEELEEVDLLSRVSLPNVNFRHVRSMWEGPEPVPGEIYTQFRIFEVYGLAGTRRETKRLRKRLFDLATNHEDLLVVSAKEIIAGRCSSGELIAPHAVYLVYDKRVRPDLPMFVRKEERRGSRAD